jgi:heme-degrading monooxygenase HmoA
MNKKIIKTLTLILVLLFGISLTIQAKPQCKKQTVEEMVKAVSASYEAKTLASLDADRPYLGKVRVVIEHSLADDNARDRFVIRRFASLARFEAWLKSREHEEMPARESRPLTRCAKGVCTYNFDGGILHNHLYLKKITYGVRSGCPYIKTIYLLDGD